MKICKTYTVEIKDEDGNATLVFRRPKLNEAHEREVEISKLPENSPEKARAQLALVLSELESATGITDTEGNPITVEELKDLGIDGTTLMAIIKARSHALFGNVDPEKKDSTSAS